MLDPFKNPYIETKLLREVCRNSFYQFCREFAPLIVPEEIVWNWHHEYLCQKFQEVSIDVLEGRPKRGDLIVDIAPGTMKCECEGNLILTPNGYIPVEKLDLDDEVYSFGKNQKLFRQKIISKGSYYGNCVTLVTVFGQENSYSHNHPIFTKRGWVEVENLTNNDVICRLNAIFPENERVPDDVLDLLDFPCRWERVKGIKPAGKQKVYYIGVSASDYDEQNYFSNNILVHNSTLLSQLLPVWLHTINPRFRFITASFDVKLSYMFARQSKYVMDSPLYKKLFHDFRYSPERQGEYVNQYGGSRLAFSTGQSPTGRHANMIIIDDPVDPQLVDSETKIRDITFWMNTVIRPRVANVLSTPLILVMQRLHYQDPIGEWLENAKLKPDAKVFHISLPAEIDRDHRPIPAGLSRYYKDGLLDPNRLGREALIERKTWMSNADYEAQYLQNPLKTEGLMFKIANIEVRQLDTLDPIVHVIRYWDKAISVSDTACYTAGVKLGKTRSGRWCVLDVRRGKWGLYERENMIRNTAESDGLGCIVAVEQEPGPLYEEERVLVSLSADEISSQTLVQKKLKDVVEGDFVINHLGKPTRVTAVHEQGYLPVLVIHTVLDDNAGFRGQQIRKIRAHKSHPFCVGSGWVNAEELMEGVYLTRMLFDGKKFEKQPEKIVAIQEASISMPCRCLTVEDGESFLCNDIVVHNSGGKESAMNTVRNLAGFVTFIDPAGTAKEVRARPFAIQVEQGNVFCIPASWNDAFLSELAAFPQGKWKDQVDAVVGGFNILAQQHQRVACAF